MSRVVGVAIGAVVLAIGVAVAGWFVGNGFVEARTGDRFVTVKGLSEREVQADLALWPMKFVATSNDLGEAQNKLKQDARAVTAFLDNAGIPESAVDVQSIQVTDLLAQQYRSGPVESRFIVSQTLMVRSPDIDAIAAASQRIGDLVDAGVVLSADNPMMSGPIYLFTRLTDLKPAMIAEATANARQGAEQFAADSGSHLGGIRRANQGVFQILARDNAPGIMEETQILKTVRVVSTIDYYLED
ncbi:MAG: SIMPL domain-containing protein [Rhodospirillaceae bacterium]|nr:SIMPL domain-containing protein [Rhodospirillaceae bacterium]|tara:strand:+ start:477 stop:1208 length:732 start_codon:yes stop_codon:yes gene_type:complete